MVAAPHPGTAKPGPSSGRLPKLPRRVCARCVMDTSDPEIQFDGDGVCNHCRGYDRVAAQLPTPDRARRELEQIVKRVNAAGRGRRYDCVVGLSGGVDSSYLAMQAVQLGLRPL